MNSICTCPKNGRVESCEGPWADTREFWRDENCPIHGTDFSKLTNETSLPGIFTDLEGYGHEIVPSDIFGEE